MGNPSCEEEYQAGLEADADADAQAEADANSADADREMIGDDVNYGLEDIGCKE